MSRFTAETKIADAEMTARSTNALTVDGIETLGDLTDCTEDYVRRIPNLGKLSLAEIKEVLAYAGLSLHAGPIEGYPHGRRPPSPKPDVTEAYRALAEQRAWYANAGKVDLRKWCVEMAIRWPVESKVFEPRGGGWHPAAQMTWPEWDRLMRNPQPQTQTQHVTQVDCDVLGRAELLWNWIREGNL